MRFAGQRVSDYSGGATGVENFMGDSPDYGKTVQASSNIDRKKLTNTIDQQSKMTNTGIMSSADAEAAKITGAAQASYADAQGQASIMQGIGQIGGSIIGGINVGGGGGGIGGSGIGSGITGTVDYGKDFTSGMDFSNVYQNPDLVGWMK